MDFFWKTNKWAGEKVLKRWTINDNFGSEFALCTVSDDMYCLSYNNKTCSQCIGSMCLFRETRINEQMGQNSKINKRAGENKREQRGQNVEN